MRRKSLWLRRLIEAVAPYRRLRIVEGDSLPQELPLMDLVLAREDGENWCAGLRCPCGCGHRLELMLLKEVKPRWDLTLDKRGRVSLHPSVWRRSGCRSHFWVRAGKVIWCE